MKAQPNRRKWKRWIDRITDELTRSLVDREIFEQWWTIIQNNPNLDVNNNFMSFIWDSYLAKQVLVVRRQVRFHKRSISLIRLLKEVSDYSSQLTREDFMRHLTSPDYPDAWRKGQQLFDTFAGREGNHVSATRVKNDIKRLEYVSHGLMNYADKWLAHSDKRRKWPTLGFRQLNKSLDVLDKTWRRYHVIARRGPINVNPKRIAGSDWQFVFDIPWRWINADDVPKTIKNDEQYIIGLCDLVLGQKAMRQHTFDFLRGDGNPGRKLRVDAYYPGLNLVVEYGEKQHKESVEFWDKQPTISDMPRGLQRLKYDRRRRRVLPKHGIELVELSFSDFEHNANKRLHRNLNWDMNVLRNKLSKWLR